MDMKLLACRSTTTVIPNEINPISKWFAMSGCSVLVENCLCLLSSGNGLKIVSGGLEGMPCNSDLYVYLSIEVVIGLVQ